MHEQRLGSGVVRAAGQVGGSQDKASALLLRVDALSGRMLTEPPLSPAEALRLQPLDKILLALEQRYKARTVEAELTNKPGKPRYYEVDLLLDSGRGLEVLVNATTGEVIAEDALR